MTTTQETPEWERFARLETTVDYLVREVGDIKADIRALRAEMNDVRTEIREVRTDFREDMRSLREEMVALRQEARRDFRWIIATFLGVMIPTWAFIVTALIIGL